MKRAFSVLFVLFIVNQKLASSMSSVIIFCLWELEIELERDLSRECAYKRKREFSREKERDLKRVRT